MPASTEKQRKLFGAALAAKRGAKPISKKVGDIAKKTSEKELSKMASKNEGAGYDNQIGDIYAVQKPVTHDCACTDLIHKIDPMTGIQSMGIEPDQVHGVYNDEMVANQIAEKIHKEFVDAALALEKKKDVVIDKIKKTMNELEKARTECMGMIKENPMEAVDKKQKVAELTHRIDELVAQLERVQKSKKEIIKQEEKED